MTAGDREPRTEAGQQLAYEIENGTGHGPLAFDALVTAIRAIEDEAAGLREPLDVERLAEGEPQ